MMNGLPSGALTQLCFDRADFTRADFHVESFVGAVRRHATIEQVQSDLRLYLKILQNSMIELINDHYADFVQLSSNLANLRPTVTKLGADFGLIQSEFDRETSALLEAADALNSLLDEKSAQVLEQRRLEDRLRCLDLLTKLRALLSADCRQPASLDRLCPLIRQALSAVKKLDEDACLLDDLGELVKMFQRRLEAELAAAVNSGDGDRLRHSFDGLSSCGRRDAALAVFIGEFLEPPVRQCLRSNPQGQGNNKLEALFSLLAELRAKFLPLFTQPTGIPSRFDESELASAGKLLEDSLLTLLLSVLETEFSALSVPSDADDFHANYLATRHFVETWPQPSHPLLRMVMAKLGTEVYFRLRCQEIMADVDKAFERLKLDDGAVKVGVGEAVLKAVGLLWSERVYLPALCHKSWDFTCKLVKRYVEWVETLNSPTDATASGVIADSDSFDSSLFNAAFEQIWPRLRSLGADPAPFGRCLSAATARLQAATTRLQSALGSQLASAMGLHLRAVSEVPRQYRWTRRESPTEPSSYLRGAFEVLSEFRETVAPSRALADARIASVAAAAVAEAAGVYAAETSEVLATVERMATSLSRLKRGASAANVPAEGAQTSTDDQKIKAQLRIDLEEFRVQADRFSTDYDRQTIDGLLAKIDIA